MIEEGRRRQRTGQSLASRRSQKAISSSLDLHHQTLLVLARNAQTDEVRLEIAKIAVEVGKQGIEMAGILKTINDANNGFWWRLPHPVGLRPLYSLE